MFKMNPIDSEVIGQASLIYGKKLHTYGKFLILEVLLNEIKTISENEKLNKLSLAINKIRNKIPSQNIDELWSEFMENINLSTVEELKNLVFEIFEPQKFSLLYSTFYTLSKIPRMKTTESLFDNFRLTNICDGLNLIVWDDKDKTKTYGVRRKFESINENVELKNYEDICRLYVGALRKFIIENNFYQTNEIYNLIEPKSGNLDYKTICDKCYENYPFYFGGCYTCDFYKFSNISCSISEIVKFSDRYPSAILGYIINTSPSTIPGTHWVSFCLKKSVGYLICSGGHYFTNFLDNGEFKLELIKHNISIRFNPVKIQTDNHSCGMFSVLSLYEMICNNCDIEKTINKIGIDGKNIIPGKKITSFTNILSKPINENEN